MLFTISNGNLSFFFNKPIMRCDASIGSLSLSLSFLYPIVDGME